MEIEIAMAGRQENESDAKHEEYTVDFMIISKPLADVHIAKAIKSEAGQKRKKDYKLLNEQLCQNKQNQGYAKQ